ncbi:hypothetical protein AK812_SmicGene2845 [Symbiodinium microadriaticum]|uniref:Uncharacterized protein n=1 Tax=Symbiodinium microadriaticum TaxID=2951 RepID=A0A1Q9F0G2_SYMMI|nr:hypothetical protein AK812_SmicGene2845 [Symbiodinium microadriaticum]
MGLPLKDVGDVGRAEGERPINLGDMEIPIYLSHSSDARIYKPHKDPPVALCKSKEREQKPRSMARAFILGQRPSSAGVFAARAASGVFAPSAPRLF